MSRWVEQAMKVASRSSHDQFKLGCIVFRGGSVISTAPNLQQRYKCAEARALKKHYDPDRYRGARLIVVRSNGGCSKPCERCMKHIKECGIDTIYYFNWDGQIEKMKVE